MHALIWDFGISDGQVFALDLTGEAEVVALKDIISVELGIPPERQRILLDGRPLQ